MKKTLLSVFAVLAILGFAAEAGAQTLTTRHTPQLMQGMRPLGMGNAFIAVDGSDENALFYNPAGVADYENKTHMQFLSPAAEISSGAINFVGDILDLADDLDGASSSSSELDVFDDFIDNNAGKIQEIAVRMHVANFRRKYMAASLFVDNRTLILISNPQSSTIDIETVSHAGLQLGGGYSFLDDLIEVGGAIKFIERHIIDETITEREIITTDEFDDIIDAKRFGFGVGVDIGVKSRLPFKGVKAIDYLDPVFAITYQDIANTRFTGSVGTIPQSLSVGMAVHPNFYKFKSVLAMDYRDIHQRGDFLTNFHVGYELMYPDISPILRTASLRLGMNEGYFTAGVGFDFRYFKLEGATWARETGDRTRISGNRIYGVSFAAGF